MIYFQTLQACGALRVLMPELDVSRQSLEQALERMGRLPEGIEQESLSRWRWARLVEHLDETHQMALAERLRLPRIYRDLGRQAALTRQLRQHLPVDAAQIQNWLNSIDAWRRGERVTPLLKLLALDDPALAGRLAQAWQVVAQLEAKTLVAEGWRGGELGAELARRRYRLLEQALAE